MSDEQNAAAANGNRTNPLDRIFTTKQIRVSILDATGEPTGVVGVFKPIEPRVKTRYNHIIQKGFGGKKPKYDEGNEYVFPLIIESIEGLTADDCGGVDPIAFCRQNEKGRELARILMNGYWDQTQVITEDDAQKK
jgi:hypothetical protein